MVSKEILKQDIEMLKVALDCYMGNDLKEDSNLSRPIKKVLNDFEKLIDELELYKKALDYTCQNNVCFKDECDRLPTHRTCKDCRKDFVLSKATWEIEREKQ